MVLQSTGEISLSNIGVEFGDTPPYSMSEYYAGGLLVPTGISGIVASGALALNTFWGKAKVVVYGVYSFSSHTFTNASATGRNGPTLTQCRSAYSSATWTQDTTNNYLNMTINGIQLWKVPATGSYTFTIAGAKGGDALNGYVGGKGRIVNITCNLTQNEILKIVVGQSGSSYSARATGGSGGGGTYVTLNDNTIIGIGGGGGGAKAVNWGNTNGQDAPAATYGLSSTGTASATGGAGGTYQDFSYAGGGGGGFSTNGSGRDSSVDFPALGGLAFANNSLGGYGWLFASGSYGGAEGGFGGGGGLWINSEARPGGGGGYSGGDGSTYTTTTLGGGGGGSHLGSYASITASSYGGTNNGNGYVTVTANFTITRTTADTRTVTNYSIGSSTLNLGLDFGTNSSPKGTFLQYNSSGSAQSIHWFVPWLSSWKSYNSAGSSFTTSPAASFNLTSTGYTGGVTSTYNVGVSAPVVVALKAGNGFFDLGTFTGNGSANRTISHTLGVFPGLVVIFANSYHPIGIWYNASTGNADIYNAGGTGTNFTSAIFGDTGPSTSGGTLSSWLTSTTFTLPSAGNLNGVTYYWYAFANTGANIKIGTYNTSVSYNVTTGFRPGLLITEGSSGGCYNWLNPNDLTNNTLTNSANVYVNNPFGGAAFGMTFSDTGFTVPNTQNTWYANGAGDVYYMAIKSTSF